MNEIILYAVFFTVFVLSHNWLIGSVDSFEQQLARETKEKIAVSLALFVGTVLLMLFIAPTQVFNGYGLLAIGFSLVSSFLIIRFFQLLLLKEMRYQRLFLKFIIHPNFLLAVFFIIATDLLVLYWLKEIDIYFQDQFLFFEIGYAILIVIGGIFLGRRVLGGKWRLSVVAIVDPMIVVFWAMFLLEIVLGVFSRFLGI